MPLLRAPLRRRPERLSWPATPVLPPSYARVVLPTRAWHNWGVRSAGHANRLAVRSGAHPLAAAALEPALCRSNGVNATVLSITSASSFTGTGAAELIIGNRNSTQPPNGGGGKDCIVAGAVPSGKTVTMAPASGSGSVCVKGPGPGSYTYGAGCAVRG